MSGSLKGPSDSFESCQKQDDTTKKGLCLLQLRHTGMVQWGVSRQVEPADECGEDNPQLPSAIVKEEHEEDEQTVSDGSLLLSELRKKRKRPVSTQHGQSKTRRYCMRRKTNTSLKHKQIKQENSTPSSKGNFKERWSSDRYNAAENHMLEIMKAEGAVFEKPISRPALRTASRRLIGDTGLLDHLLKHIDGRVAPGGTERFRRCYNTDGIMEYWLESADLVKIKHEAGMPDPWWKPGSTIPFRDSVSSGELKLLKEEISILKRNMEEQASKEQDQANQIGKVHEELGRWRGETDQRLMGIASSLSGVQDLYKELVTWKSKTEQQITEITNSLSNMQAPKQCSATVSPTSERWEDWLANPNLDNVHGEDFGPWLDGADVTNVRKDTSMLELCTITQPWLKPCDVTAQDPICAREMGMLKDEMTKMKRDMQDLMLKRMEEDQVNMTPDSSVTANSKLELDNSLLLFQEMFKEMMKWKAKMEQQVVEISRNLNVDICCFDKTGTLTSDDMEFQGVGGLSGSVELESDMSNVPVRAAEILASCHALVFVDNKLVGDPLEKAALKGIDWTYKSDEKALPRRGGGNAVQIVQRHHFASHLKRMAVVVRIQEEFLAFVKGAPETIQDRLIDLPPLYVETYKKYTRQGSRVLALAFKSLPDMTVSEARSLDRDFVEGGLTFAGFAVFNCPIRADSATVLLELKNSSHDLVMITGDQALTACHVASQVHIITKPALILTSTSGEGYEWISPDETEKIKFGDKDADSLSETHDLCIGGDCIEMLQQSSAVLQVIPYVKVFARVAPEQKELILTTFKSVGRVTLMCGDGTNDVGALKQAHVGVALLNAVPHPTQSGSSSSETPKDGTKPSKSKKSKSTPEVPDRSDSSSQPPPNRHLTAAEVQRQKLKKMMDEMNDDADGRSAPIVKLGDASMASPFTAKHASVAPTTDVIRQGRSTLVTTLQMFKILGLNCLATAYVLSVMYLDGVKLGDVQATISGVFTASFFLFISHARPLPTLSAERPHPNIFCFYVFLSLMGQFAIHLLFLISSVKGAEAYMPEECIEPDSDFHPNLVNTVSYMVSMMLQLATFAVNYMGHPFNQSITENKPFFYALFSAAGFFTIITSDLFRGLNDWLKLVPLPPGLRNKLLIWAVLMFLSCYTWERFLRWVFPGKIPSWRKHQRSAATSLEKKHV